MTWNKYVQLSREGSTINIESNWIVQGLAQHFLLNASMYFHGFVNYERAVSDIHMFMLMMSPLTLGPICPMPVAPGKPGNPVAPRSPWGVKKKMFLKKIDANVFVLRLDMYFYATLICNYNVFCFLTTKSAWKTLIIMKATKEKEWVCALWLHCLWSW